MTRAAVDRGAETVAPVELARHERAMALPAASPGRVGTRSNTEIGKDCAVACTVVVLRVRPRLCGATVSAPPSTAAHVISNLCVTVIAPLFALRCECALRSFEIAELLLL